jgi:hypothetical protein
MERALLFFTQGSANGLLVQLRYGLLSLIVFLFLFSHFAHCVSCNLVYCILLVEQNREVIPQQPLMMERGNGRYNHAVSVPPY